MRYNTGLQLNSRAVLPTLPARHERVNFMQPQSTTKRCSHCARNLDLSAFAKNSVMKDGLQNQCRECKRDHYRANADRLRAEKREYYQNKAESIKQYQRGYRKANTEKLAAGSKIRGRAWYQSNKARAYSVSRVYVEQNRVRARVWWKQCQSRRRAQKLATMAEPVDYTALYHRDKGICHICHNPVPKSRLHYDHVIPLSKGGTHTEANIKVSHARCNLKKGARI